MIGNGKKNGFADYFFEVEKVLATKKKKKKMEESLSPNIVVYVYHTCRDERTTLCLPHTTELTVKDVKKLATERMNSVFGTAKHGYTVDNMRVKPSLKSKAFVVPDDDSFWRSVNASSDVFLILTGDITTTETEKDSSEENEDSPKKNAPANIYFTLKEKHSEQFLVPGKELQLHLRGVIPISDLYMDKEVEIPVNELLAYKNKIDQQLKECGEVSCLDSLSKWLVEKAKAKREHLDRMLDDGVISFWDLWQIFTPETNIIVMDDGVGQGYRIVRAEYIRGWAGIVFDIKGEFVMSDGEKFYFKQHSITVPAYDGLKPVLDLSIQIPTEEQTSRLIARGRDIARRVKECSYREYDGQFRIPQDWRGTLKLSERGKVMIDIENYNRAMSNGYNNDHFVGKNSNAITGNGKRGVGDDDVLFAFYARLPAFSFQQKRWGIISWEHSSEIQFNHKAFDALVMEDNDQKQLIRGLVKQRLIVGSEVSDDLISGKGSGCVFLLYGPPGTGKTLTAEATAELLERPLYQITVAELGTDAEQLEDGLEKALRLASHWRAVVLMDEADNFLERRGKNDLERNAMVSVFLRLLEYYDGVLFLTTNRVNEFDPAFYSRISVPIMYPELSKNVRRKVWTNLLEAAITKLDDSITLEALAAFNLNGREIRNCIYLAQCTAQFTGRSANLLTSSELLVPIDMKLKFREAMEKQQIE